MIYRYRPRAKVTLSYLSLVKMGCAASRIIRPRLMPSSKRPKRLPSPGEDMESIFAMSSMDPEWDPETDQFHSLLTLFTNQMKREIRPVSDHS